MVKKKTTKKKTAKKKKNPSSETRGRPRKDKPRPQTPSAAPGVKADPMAEKISPIPTAGDNPKFKDLLDRPTITEPAKRGRGRPRKTAEPEAPEIATAGNPLFEPLLKMPFDLWAASQKVEALSLTDQESKNLVLPITQLFEYYCKDIPEIAIAWIGLCGALYGITQPRLKLLKSIRKIKQAADARTTAAGDTDNPPPTPPVDETSNTFPTDEQIKPVKVSH